ncbi:hypothetical protein AR438_04725 [Chryseobacterium aquaticum]|uniref:Uncharacterized protein n=1 Tax=Chryseobacterium aquaticum TaxID=452084 RepID=A0A0Q3HVD4_9FLAO|nr:hypothetical protein AC804_02025 [Chryseobacterium sp. Hurlbut01]KQK26557.1 hypothetical protein AR438_04725 [Chryseobacterium aquaticum]
MNYGILLLLMEVGCWKLAILLTIFLTSCIQLLTYSQIKSKDNKKTTQNMSSFCIVNKVTDYFFK